MFLYFPGSLPMKPEALLALGLLPSPSGPTAKGLETGCLPFLGAAAGGNPPNKNKGFNNLSSNIFGNLVEIIELSWDISH